MDQNKRGSEREKERRNYTKRNSNNKNNNLICCYGSFHKKHSKKIQSTTANERKSDIDCHLSLCERERQKKKEQIVPQDHSLTRMVPQITTAGRGTQKTFDMRIIIISSSCHDKKEVPLKIRVCNNESSWCHKNI